MNPLFAKRFAKRVAMLVVLSIVALFFWSENALCDAPEWPGLAADAASYVNALQATTTRGSPKADQQTVRDEAVRQANLALANHDPAKAVAAFERAIAARDDRSTTWRALAEAQASLTPPNLPRALQAGWLASSKAIGPEQIADWIWISQLFEGPLQKPQAAILGYQAVLSAAKDTKTPMPDIERKLTALRLVVGLSLKNITPKINEYPARLCLTFSDKLKVNRETHFEDFVRLDPAVPTTAFVDGSELCLSGLTHGTRYSVTVRQGLPGIDGLVLKHDEQQTIQIDDRPPSVAFRGAGFILVRGDLGAVPVVTVNLDTVGIRLYRINDRNLAGSIKEEKLRNLLSSSDSQQIGDSDGELLWEGKLSVKGDRNKEGVTGLPIRQLIPNPKPGLYVVIAAPADVPENQKPWHQATQWLMVSDFGLTTTRGADGIHVFVRSLASAKPVAGVDIALIARNNSELAHATTDQEGHAVFGPGLARGTGGQSPMMISAYGHDGDFAMLDLTLAAFDLSDRGVGGRAAPGPMDAYLYTERGVYRPGETVHVTALLRDEHITAVDHFPLLIKVLRPTGTVFYTGTLPLAAGGIALPINLTASAPLGGWTIQAFGDPKTDPIGSVGFQVEEFIPERLSVDLQAQQPILIPGQPFDLLVSSHFLYGPPAAGLGGSADVALEEDPDPYPQCKGYHFGLAQEQVTARVNELILPTTDGAGQAHLAVELPPQPDTTKPLRATLRVAVAEPGGRPTHKTLTVPVRTQSYVLGIKGRFDEDRVNEGQSAAFEVIALTPEGQRLDKPSLHWELVAEHHDFQWYYEDGHYKYKVIERDQSVRAGTLAATVATPTLQDVGSLPFGRFRFEVTDTGTGVASSYRFWSGWDVGPSASDTPDTVEVSADKPAYVAGETAHIRIQPPFAGEVLLTVATNRLLVTRTLSVPKTGATVEVVADKQWGPGAYVTATVYRPPVHGKDRLPIRAIGLTWLTLDPAAHTLTVTTPLPDVVRPNQTLEVPIQVTPVEPETFVTVAAVDEGILQLTQFVSPDPGKYFFAKRVLGIDIRDDYGRLIDTMDGPLGELRQGGDSSGLAGGLPKVPITVVSLFQGPVALDATGKARISFTIPNFNGQLRVMAVAFNRERVGSVSTKLIVRDPLVVESTLPRFLAPGDLSQLTLSVHNVEAPAGQYHVLVNSQPPLQITEGSRDIALAKEERQTLTFPITATGAGIANVTVSVLGPGALKVQESIDLTVRPSRAVESHFVVQPLPPGGTLVADAHMLEGYVPGTAGVSFGFSAGPPFDVQGLLAALDRYPYGCLEQLISRAFPLLVVNDVTAGLGKTKNPSDPGADAKVDAAIAAVLDKQRYDGSFGLWSAHGEAEAWLTAYAMEFLIRARTLHHPVPDAPYLSGLTWLRQQAIDGGSEEGDLASRAYALYDLSLAGVLTPGPVRYFHDAFVNRFPTALAAGQVGAALERLGDHDRAQVAFDTALSKLERDYWPNDYGSAVRDAAALVTLLGEVGLANENRLATLMARLPASKPAVAETNTQEQAWLLLAANTLMKGTGPLDLTLNNQPMAKTDPVRLLPSVSDLASGLTIRNAGWQALWESISDYGVPSTPKPADREGLRIKRWFFRRDGSPVNLDAIKQNDVFVVVLTGEATTKLLHQAILTQPLPAGWELENSAIGGSGTEGMWWLTDLTDPDAAERRDDRYIAAVTLTGEKPNAKLAFLVRAVTPGSYELPGAKIEDMYKPRFFARQATGRVTVQPALP